MDYFNIGDTIDVKKYNSLVYLLRKFKRLNTALRLGSLILESDYGTFVFDKPLTSVGSNFIIEEAVNISSSDCLKNCFYSFIFTAIDVNTSGIVNKRQVKVTGNTGENGSLFITLPTDLIDSDEVLLPYFDLDIVFDSHEYYTPVVDAVNVDLVSDKTYVLEGETATITATLTGRDDEPLASVPCTFIVNGESYPTTTDENGQSEYTYTSTGEYSKIEIKVISTTLTIYDTPLTANVRGNYIRFLGNGNNWLKTDGDCVIDWGDGTTETVNNPTTTLIHTYTDSEQTHTIAFLGVITSLGDLLFANSGLISINIPNSITSFGRYCFNNCDLLESIIIPDSVASIGDNCFQGCYYLADYQLYWIGDAIIPYDNHKMPNNETSVFTIPRGQTSNYVARGYPSAKLSERSGIITILTLESSKSSYYTDESVILSGLLVDENNNPLTSAYVKIYNDNALISTLPTDSNGEYNITLNLAGIPTGTYNFKAVYAGDTTYEASTSNDCSIIVQNHTYSLSIASDKQTMYTDESVIVSGVLLKDGTGYASQSVDLYDSVTKIDSLTTDSNGNYSKTVTGLTEGIHIFKAVLGIVQSSTINVTVKEPEDYALSVASTKDILSYDDSESATITATLTNNGIAVAGETLSYVIKHGSTTIATGSDTTDANGEISFSYASTGVGNVTVEVDFGTLLQETYALEDLYLYDPMTSNSGHWNVPSDATYQYNEYSSNGWKIGNASAYKYIPVDIDVTLPFKVSVIINGQSGNNPGFNFGGRYVEFYADRININGSTTYHSLQVGNEYSVHFYSDHIEVWKGDTSISSRTITVPSTNPFEFSTGANRYMQIKDLKIKAL